MSTHPQNTPHSQDQFPDQNDQQNQHSQQNDSQGTPRRASRLKAPIKPKAYRPEQQKKAPLDPLVRLRITVRAAILLIVAALFTFGASAFVLSPMPYFLGLFVFAVLGIGLNITAIVRTVTARGPWVFYVAASLSIIYGFVTLLGGIGMATMPGAQEYRQCRAAALTQTDVRSCDQTFQERMNNLSGFSASPVSGSVSGSASTASH